jgi:hypothetical protein
MKKILLIISSLLVLTLPIQARAQDTASVNTVVTSLNSSAGGASTAGTAFATPGNPASMITWTTAFASAPASVTILLQGSLDSSTYYTLDTSTNVNGEIRSITTAAKFFRCFISAKSGGGNTTCSAVTKTQPTSTAGLFLGGTVTAPMLFSDGTAAAPSIAAASSPTNGFYFNAADATWTYSTAGNARMAFTTGIYMGSGTPLVWSSTATPILANGDASLNRIGPAQISAGNGTVQPVINGTLTTSTTSACTIANTTETDLWTYTLPANALNADGRGLRITVFMTSAATANVKTYRLYFNGTVLIQRAVADNNLGSEWSSIVLRTGVATQYSFSHYLIGGASNVTNTVSPTATLSSSVIIKMTGQNDAAAAANDVCFKAAIVETIK